MYQQKKKKNGRRY